MEELLRIRQMNEQKEKLIQYLLLAVPSSFIIIGGLLQEPMEIFNGFKKIVQFPDSLITDYIAIGGISATLMNAGILMLLNFWALRKTGMQINGFFIAGYFIIGGFAFMGNNLVNVLPIYGGTYLYAKYQKEDYKRFAVIGIFSTSLAPLITEIVYLTDNTIGAKVTAGIMVGVFLGFVMPVLAAHMMKFHEGFNLYNVGFTSGVIGTVVVAVMRGYGVVISSHLVVSSNHERLLVILVVAYALLFIGIGYYLNQDYQIKYRQVFKYSGRLITDYVMLTGYGTTLINMGLMALVGVGYVALSGADYNGAVMAGIMTLTGFSALGNHPKNSIPIMLGVFIGAYTKIWDLSSVGVVISGLFGTTLAPIAGVYGAWAGILAGFLHLSVVMNIGYLHGGVNLYNNGFSGGLVAAVLVPIIDAFRREE